MDWVIVAMEAEHWGDVRRIYLEGIATGNATFQTEAPDWAAWDSAHHAHSRLVALEDGRVAGWAALRGPNDPCKATAADPATNCVGTIYGRLTFAWANTIWIPRASAMGEVRSPT